MYALEPEPEGKGRWRRLGLGGLLALGVTAALFVIASKVEPARRLLSEVVQMAVVEVPPPPPPEALPPPPPPPPPPKPKEPPPPPEPAAPAEQEPAPDPQPDQPPPEAEPEAPPGEQAGLDPSSFGEGAGGPAFGVGHTQMGDPSRRGGGRSPSEDAEATTFVSAASVTRVEPTYSFGARRRRIEGFVVLEVAIDERGTPTSVRVQQPLDPELDQAAVEAVRKWRFRPATLGGRPKASVHLVRIHFRLR